MDLFVDLAQHHQIHEARERADAARDKALGLESLLHDAVRRIEALALANQALYELLREKMGISDEEVIRRMQEVDVRDGVRDRKMGGKPVPCPSCRRLANSVRRQCLYCGAVLPGSHVFGR